MDNFQKIFTTEEFIKRLPAILPEYDHRKYTGKSFEFPFAHSNARVEFFPVDLRQKLPGKEVFKMSHQECPSECEKHGEELRNIVRNLFHQVQDERTGKLKMFFKQAIIRKRNLINDMSIEEFVKNTCTLYSGVKANFRNQYMVSSIEDVVEILESLGAVKKTEKEKEDTLLVQFENQPFRENYHVYLDPSTMLLSKVTQRAYVGKECFLFFPTPASQKEKIFDGIILNPRKKKTIGFSELCGMCSDGSLLSILKTPGLGALSKHQDPERFAIHESSINSVGHLFLRQNRIKYKFDLDGVEIVLTSSSGLNHSFDEDEIETKVHQRLKNDVSLEFRKKGNFSIDIAVNVVACVIMAVKNAVQAGKLRLAMYDVVESMKNRFRDDMHRSPKWCAESPRQIAHGRSEVWVMKELRRVRDGRSLEEMLDVQPGIHLIPLRAATRSMLAKINEMKRWNPGSLQANGLNPDGSDLTWLEQKVRDAAAERNLTV